jgi:large conductance mechanosensitive channel
LAKDDEILAELRRIRELLETKPAPPAPPPKGLWAEFMDFLSKYKVFGLAVAFILALYLGQLIQALVNDLIMPILGYVTPGGEWQTIAVGKFMIGQFIAALITFTIVVAVIFLLVKMTKRWGIE